MPTTEPTRAPDGVHLVDHLPADFDEQTLRADVRRGLTSRPLHLSPKWLYDKVGSELFDEITRLPEYYPTRCERSILQRRAAEIVALAGGDALVELGSGSSEKTRLLLDAMVARAGGEQVRYVGVDVSIDALTAAAEGLARDYPGLDVGGVRADFETQLHLLPAEGHRVLAFLGSTIGNLEPAARRAFLAEARSGLRSGEHFLLGADLVKSPEVLVPAYDDAQGVTAAFDLNVLDVLGRRLGADVDRDDFRHVAVWDADAEWMEMRLVAQRDVVVRVAALDLEVAIAEGEYLRTEISAKFRRDGLSAELAEAGFEPRGWWTDDAGLFSLSLWRAS